MLQLDPIAVNERQAVRKVRLHRDAGLDRFAAGELNHLADRLVDVQAILPRWRLLDEGTDSLDDVARSMAGLNDTTERLPGLLQVRRLGAQPA